MHLFNITEIERSNNPPLLLEFYGGDITGVYSDVLLISAFRSDYFPFVGTVFWRIKEKFGIEFGDHIPEGSKLVVVKKTIFKPLQQQLQPRIECFGDNEITNGIQAARWCLEHHLIQQGYTILLETLVSHTLKLAGQDPMDMKLRPIVQSTAKIVRTQLPEAQWKGPAADHIQLTHQIMEIVQNRPMLKLIDVLLQERNDLNHAGYNASPRKPSTFFNKLQEHIQTFEEIIN